jgi:hypothetical protein
MPVGSSGFRWLVVKPVFGIRLFKKAVRKQGIPSSTSSHITQTSDARVVGNMMACVENGSQTSPASGYQGYLLRYQIDGAGAETKEQEQEQEQVQEQISKRLVYYRM